MHFYYEYRTAILVLAVALPLAVGVWHFFAVGPKETELAKLPQTVQRFGLWHRLVHILRALSFVTAGLTGYWLAFETNSPTAATTPHVVLGRIFAAASVVSMLFLLKPGLPRAYDLEWLKRLGGYLTKRPLRLRAGKFNAGQKIFIWLGLLLAIGLAVTGGLLEQSEGSAAWYGSLRVWHALLAASTIAAVIGHVYLSLLAVPGTWRVMLHGRVAKEWLVHHHPDDGSIPSSGSSADESDEHHHLLPV